MEKNYEQLYRLPGGLFLDGAPVFIKEGTLWQHKENAGLFAQLNIRNISVRTVTELTVRLSPIAPNGAVLGDGTEYQYRQQVVSNGMFGAQQLIQLPEGSCAFGACVTNVCFDDGSTWEPENRRAWHVAPEEYDPQAPAQKKKRN